MKGRLIPHPVLFGVYSVVFACANNIDFAPPIGQTVALLLLLGTAAALLSKGAAYVIGDPEKGAIVASTFILMFFSYGHLRDVLAGPLNNFHILTIGIGPEKVLGVGWAAAWFGLWRWLPRGSSKAIDLSTRALNRAGVALILLGGLTLGVAVHAATAGDDSGRGTWPDRARTAVSGQSARADQRLPDIYYIILDGYARSDVLKQTYNYDNSAFMDWLRAAGFYVADESRSNYLQTMLSLASSLNVVYLQPNELTAAAASGSSRQWRIAVNAATARYLDAWRRPLVHMIQYSSVVRSLKEHGYRFVALTSEWGGVQFPHADVVVRPSVLSDFAESLISTTPLGELEHLTDPLNRHRQRMLYSFDHLADRREDDAPNFVFVHILSPHPPFIFEADGTPVQPGPSTPSIIFHDDIAGASGGDREIVARAYTAQLQFINRKVEQAIAAILATASRPPIIIVQSDHGSDMTLDWSHPSAAGLRERMAILNAYYVPPEIRTRLYSRISPVNTFRILLSYYFGGASNLLSDETYFSTYESPYQFTHVAPDGEPDVLKSNSVTAVDRPGARRAWVP